MSLLSAPGNVIRAAVGAALFLGLTPLAWGQKGAFRAGYVVLAATPADTLRGEVDLYRAGRVQPQVLFRTAQQAPRTYGLDELLAAGDATGLQYRRCQVPKGEANVPAMLQVLVAGPASLYSDPTGQLPAPFYLDKPGRQPMPLKREQFMQVLETAFADCPSLSGSRRYVYAASELRQYVAYYNRCVYPQATMQNQPVSRSKDRVRLGVQAGLARVFFYRPYRAGGKALPGTLTPTFGLLATLPLNNHFAVFTGFTYNGYRSDNSFSELIPGSSYLRTYRYQTKGSVVRWPLALRITARRPEALWRPYFQAGIQMSYLLASELKTQISHPDPNTPQDDVSTAESIDGLGRGLHGEAGLLLPCGKARLGIGLRGESTNGFPVRGRLFLTDFRQLTLGLTYYH
ncbi:PorT family protein [Hymenobacter gummosus]|uniref:PorT family protein n=1 Tax=Hymenobacter gummosus TaxID=1776032 RepID=A0A3S0IL35_9BACT|nr:outer membrane beta-barrel protein [Hymenobacter gummosus]RTQ47170.1 PorT family protein [Hymenobacter gummosus]